MRQCNFWSIVRNSALALCQMICLRNNCFLTLFYDLLPIQVYEESGFFENILDTANQQGKAANSDMVSVVTYNANSSFSLVR